MTYGWVARCKPDTTVLCALGKSLDSLCLKAYSPGKGAGLLAPTRPNGPLRRYIVSYNFWAQKIYRQYYHRRRLKRRWRIKSNLGG